MKKVLVLIQILALIFPVMIFFGYIIMDDGDQFTEEHYMITALSAIPFIFSLLVKFLMSGADQEK
jgi:uncharacterized membrane protein